MDKYFIYYEDGFNYKIILGFLQIVSIDKSLNRMCAFIPNGRSEVIQAINGIKKIEKC